jgi:hypothetical protein
MIWGKQAPLPFVLRRIAAAGVEGQGVEGYPLPTGRFMQGRLQVGTEGYRHGLLHSSRTLRIDYPARSLSNGATERRDVLRQAP